MYFCSLKQHSIRSYSVSIAMDDIHALRLEYKTTCDALEHWRGGDPTEQEFLIWKKDQLFRSLLQQSYESAEA